VVCPLMREIRAFRYFWPRRRGGRGYAGATRPGTGRIITAISARSRRPTSHGSSTSAPSGNVIFLATLTLPQQPPGLVLGEHRRLMAQPQWPGKLTTRDLGALTPLIWEHVNPYGSFELDMAVRLPID
jgi:hypothetical protein